MSNQSLPDHLVSRFWVGEALLFRYEGRHFNEMVNVYNTLLIGMPTLFFGRF